MSLGSQDISEARAAREEREHLVREGRGMSWADAFLYLRDELGYGPVHADQALNEADQHRMHAIEGHALYLVSDTPHTVGWPSTGRYHVEA